MSFWTLIGWLAWSASFVNIAAVCLQLRRMWASRSAEGVSLGMLAIFVYVQSVFCLVGFHERQWALFYGMLGSFVTTCLTIAVAVRLRRTGHPDQAGTSGS
ncbi:hypothetical protein ABZ319_07135 [Nocardia sp. NPDC005978]|uniref:hypothetical protein n=1 Tax=Nocardia sp. NPDC005978 TaxID=3156725 RepID=UPI0033AB9A24